MTHTPGPWTSYNASGGRVFNQWRIIDSEKLLVATVAERPGGESEPANALLIAAAPELLAALQELYINAADRGETEDDDGNEYEDWKAARLAIQSATNPTP